MQEYGNLEGLLQILRQDSDAEKRARAARAIGQMDELDAANALTAAALNDPDPGVRQAARLALHDLLGNQAEMVLQMAASGAERDEDWPAQPEEGEPAEPGFAGGPPESGLVDYQTLRGLIMIARGDPSRDLRLKAVAALAQVTDLTAIRALAELALWDEDKGVRAAAEAALRDRFGSRLPDVLEGYRREMMGDEEENDLPEPHDPFAAQPAASGSWDSPPAQKEEAASTIGCLLLIFLLLAAMYLIFR